MGSMGDSYCLAGVRQRLPDRLHAARQRDLLGRRRAARRSACRRAARARRRPARAPTTRWEVNDTLSDASREPDDDARTCYDLVSCPSTTSTTARERRLVQDRAAAETARRHPARRRRRDRSRPPPLSLGRHGRVASTSLTPNEEINKCLPAATYYVKVNGYGHARSEYLLSTTSHAGELQHDVRRRRERGRRHVQPGARDARIRRYTLDRQRDLPERRRLVQGHAVHRRDADDRPDVHAERRRRRTSTSTSTRTASTCGRATSDERRLVLGRARPGRVVERARDVHRAGELRRGM